LAPIAFGAGLENMAACEGEFVMVGLWVRAGVISLAAFAASCAGTPAAIGPDPSAPPSPRAECAHTSVTIYFNEESATLQPLADPLIGELLERVSSCQTAGGELRAIWVVPYPDSGADRAAREAEIQERGSRVRAALVEAGAPSDKVRIQRPVDYGRGVMQRRVEVIADLW
jgi:hypothetical protein